ncbi:YraN family protein [Chromohalobacter israelensis]|uniref:YraN family protein n=1 Tax=Chromohalobacter israelensis TaxID=141390 RepID=UPI00265C48C1|nr:YraN family protein [Chromohalobacter salexigens]MDO0946303.1 YraN family protein [Chromohalobacter salexigens]
MSNSNNDSRRRGLEMERRAADWLASHGLSLVDANQHARRGEIDLIMRDGDTLVFIEVRHRRDARHGHPFETVTAAKQRRLIGAARFYLHRNGLSCACRFDVVGVTGTPPHLSFEWIRSAFDAF